jgi:hypothetical protein
MYKHFDYNVRRLFNKDAADRRKFNAEHSIPAKKNFRAPQFRDAPKPDAPKPDATRQYASKPASQYATKHVPLNFGSNKAKTLSLEQRDLITAFERPAVERPNAWAKPPKLSGIATTNPGIKSVDA